MANIPAYRYVYTEIKQKIKNGSYKVDSLLPTEPELEKIFGVSRTTVRKAVSLLSAEGYLNARQGKGTKVLDISTTQNLNTVTSVTESLKLKGYTVTSQGMCIERIPAPIFISEIMQIPSDAEVYHIQRVQLVDGKPISIMENFLKASLVPGLEQYINRFIGLYSLLEKNYNVIIKDATESITAIAASFTDSQILGIPLGTPLLQTKRITNTELEIFEYALIKIVAEKYEYCVHLKGRI